VRTFQRSVLWCIRMVILRMLALFENFIDSQECTSLYLPQTWWPVLYSCQKKVAQHVVFLTALLNKICLVHAEWPLCDELTSVTFSLVGRQSVRNCNPEPRLCNIKLWKFTSRRRLTLYRVRIVCLCRCLLCILVRDTKPIFMDRKNPRFLWREVRFHYTCIMHTYFYLCYLKIWFVWNSVMCQYFKLLSLWKFMETYDMKKRSTFC
jgi:hypothetical protein